MKTSLVLIFLSVSYCFSQEVKQKDIQILESEEVKVRNISFGVIGGGIIYYGEESTDLTFDYGLVLRKHINPKFDIDYNLHYGETKYVNDSLDLSETIPYYGINSTFNVNLIEAFTNKKTYSKISPYVGAGLGLLSSRPYRGNKEFVFFYVPVSAGININPCERFIVGLHATGRFLLSDEWDNDRTTSAKDFQFYPSVSLKYVFGRRNKTERTYKTKTISYKEDSFNNNGEYQKYEEKQIDSLVEISVKEYRDSLEGINASDVSANNSINNNSTVSNTSVKTDYLFYTIQIATFKSNTESIEEGAGVKEDFKFYNTKTKRYNYCKGFYSSVEEAKSELILMQKKNPDAFITAIDKGEKIKLYFAKLRLANNETKVDTQKAKEDYAK